MEDETAWEGLKCSDRFRQAQHTWQAAGTGETVQGEQFTFYRSGKILRRYERVSCLLEQLLNRCISESYVI